MMPAPANPFVHFHRRDPARPFIVAQLGQSLDGRIATRTGDSRGIGAAPSLDHLHAIRAHVEAVLVGIGTVAADDPQLNVRRCAGRNPARIVVDARGTLSPGAKCLAGADGVRRIVFRAEGVSGTSLPAGVEVVHLPVCSAGHFDLRLLAARLLDLGFEKVLIEGGARIISRAIDAGIVDRLHLMISSVILGSGQPGLELSPIDLIRDARRPRVEVIPLGQGDVLFDCEMNQNEASHG
jgi:diaminohydroxyphosphoribosylaminopyrimidine deaminase / 5-amino-6-(5-phosphoribosylamino)uracil reductase